MVARAADADPYFHSSVVRTSILLAGCLIPVLATWCFFCLPPVLAGSFPDVFVLFLATALSLLWLSPVLVVLRWPNEPLRDEALSRYLQQGGDASAPIRVPADWPNIACPRREIRRRLPILGWPIGLLYDGKYEILDELVRRRLMQRKQDIGEYWSEFPDYWPIVPEVQRILGKTCWGFTPVFVPEDEYRAVGQMLTGDLCEFEAILGMESRFGVRIVAGRKTHPAFNGSMLDVVAFLDLGSPLRNSARVDAKKLT